MVDFVNRYGGWSPRAARWPVQDLFVAQLNPGEALLPESWSLDRDAVAEAVGLVAW